jgi:alpha-beta hydrolase superfamily lysophospholipase
LVLFVNLSRFFKQKVLNLELIENNPVSFDPKKTFLLIHGMWHGAWCWEPKFLPYLEKLGYKAYALSLSNHGKSLKRKKMNLLRINDYVNDVKEVVDSLEETPVLIGHSMGGFVVQKYLEKYTAPGAVLLASVPPFGILGGTLTVMKAFPGAFLKANVTLNLKYIIDSTKKISYLMFSDRVKEEEIKEYQKKTDSESYLAYMDMLGLNLVRTKKIKTPLMVFGAGKDKAVSPESVKKTAKIYHTEAMIFEEMGHDMMLEPGYEEIIDRIIIHLENEF